jgi:hypothetical protein
MNRIRNRHMKRAGLLTALAGILLMATACGRPSGGANSPTGGFGNGGSGSGFRSGGASAPLNPEAKLALGTIKLEGSKDAVDPKMAASLLPLWQLMFELKSSSSTAPQEVTAVMDKIDSTMRPEQVTTIQSMSLSQADIFAVFQQQAQASGSTAGQGGGGGAQGPQASGSPTGGGGTRRNGGGGGNRGFVFVGGGGPGGGFGGAGGFGGGELRNNGGTGSTNGSTLSAAEVLQARQNAEASLLINQLIRLLETKLSK